MYYLVFFFFFQAEDGIRDYKVTGVQTCALPISQRLSRTAYGYGGSSDVARHGNNRRRVSFSRANLPHEIDAIHERDRKSTRLNSSHLVISYAVFCLKKKNNHPTKLG